MKNQLTLLLISSLFFFGCSAIDELTEFDIDYTEEFTIPSTSGIKAPVSITTPAITSDLESKTKEYGSAINLIEDVTIKSVDLTITSPDSVDYSFLTAISVYIVDEAGDKIVASRTDISESIGKELELNTSEETDLLPYLLNETFKLKVVGTMRDGTFVDIENQVDLILTIDAKLI